MKKRIVHSLFFIFALLALLLPVLKITFAPAPPQTFNVTVTITNSAPNITFVGINGDITEPFSVAPLENASRLVQIEFNVSDGNSAGDINDGSVRVQLSTPVTTKTNVSACVLVTTGVNDKRFNCTLHFEYFDQNATFYDLNITAYDNSSSKGENFTTAAFTYSILTAIELTLATLQFQGVPGAVDVRPNSDIRVRNTGNDRLRRVNITAYDLNGKNQIIGVTNFTVNYTNSSEGNVTGNGTEISFSNDTFLQPVNTSNMTLFFTLNISRTLTEKTYNASKLWSITVSRDKA